jgi:hypothetical protein
MDSTDIVTKTAAGVEELRSRSGKLPPRLRTMLIIIDGSMNAGQLQLAAAKLDVPGDFVEALVRQGLVAVVPSGTPAAVSAPLPSTVSDAERFRTAQKFMNDTVVDALGFRAFFFTLKLERCSTMADLLGLLDDYRKAVVKGSGTEIARVLVARARVLLAG